MFNYFNFSKCVWYYRNFKLLEECIIIHNIRCLITILDRRPKRNQIITKNRKHMMSTKYNISEEFCISLPIPCTCTYDYLHFSVFFFSLLCFCCVYFFLILFFGNLSTVTWWQVSYNPLSRFPFSELFLSFKYIIAKLNLSNAIYFLHITLLNNNTTQSMRLYFACNYSNHLICM